MSNGSLCVYLFFLIGHGIQTGVCVCFGWIPRIICIGTPSERYTSSTSSGGIASTGWWLASTALLCLSPSEARHRRQRMGGCPSTEEAPCSSDGAVVTRRELWASTLQIGGCHHRVLDELLLGERRFIADMHVRKAGSRSSDMHEQWIV